MSLSVVFSTKKINEDFSKILLSLTGQALHAKSLGFGTDVLASTNHS